MVDNRWKLSNEMKEKCLPIVKGFIDKMEALTPEQIENMSNEEFKIELSDTGLRPYTLLELMGELGYDKDGAKFDDNGWELDFWISINKKGVYFPSSCERMCIHGCGMTFELNLSVSEFM